MSGKLSPPALELILIEDDEVDAMAVRRAIQALEPQPELRIYPRADRALQDPALSPGGHGPPPLVLLDLNLPGLSGLAFLRQLRTKGFRADTPVVVLTTSADHRDRAAALQLHAAGYFVKPVDAGELRDLIAMLAAYWRRSLGMEPA